MMTVFCDKDMFHMVADVLMSESDTFVDTYGMLGVCGVDPAFEDLVQRLTTSPASSASIERVGFSTFSFIHNKIRNRLGVQKASKLVFCYHMLHGTKDLDW